MCEDTTSGAATNQHASGAERWAHMGSSQESRSNLLGAVEVKGSRGGSPG